ncbi:hypothetical protein BLOT_009776 [Blomia tropicalis]|nr:hypothetical protein BLOT_009776 [Blomia tropicalis]
MADFLGQIDAAEVKANDLLNNLVDNLNNKYTSSTKQLNKNDLKDISAIVKQVKECISTIKMLSNNQLISNILSKIDNIPSNTQPSQSSYAQVTTGQEPLHQYIERKKEISNEHTLIVSAKDNNSPVEVVLQVNNSIKHLRSENKSLKINKVIKSKKGVIIKTPNKEDIDLLMEDLNSVSKLTNISELPKILCDMNAPLEGMEKKFHVMFALKSNSDTQDVVVRVSPKAYEIIKSLHRVYTYDQAIEIRDKVMVRQCQNCFSYDHNSKFCKSPKHLFQNDGESTYFYSCGGSVLNDQWIITAANCLNDPKGNGKLVTRRVFLNRLEINVLKWFVPKGYNPQLYWSPYDIALFKLAKPIDFADPRFDVGIKCGVPEQYNNDRIIGGVETGQHEFPWMAYLSNEIMVNGKKLLFTCGGSVIDAQWILTAAHCLKIPDNSDLISRYVLLSAHNVENPREDHLKLDVASSYYPNDYDPEVHNSPNDIALLKLAKPIDFVDPRYAIKLICLPEKDEELNLQSNCETAGWGKINAEGPYSSVLLKVMKRIWDEKMCHDEYPETIDTQFCAGDEFHGTCLGDSGGPLQCWNNFGVRTLYGIVSYGDEDCKSRPGVFTKVSKYIDWINYVIKQN